jgi:hypothetical protein
MNTANQLVVIPLEQLIAILEDFFNRFRDEQNAPYHSLREGSSTKVYTRDEVAAILKKCPNTISKYIKQRKLHATPLNGQYIINEKELVKFINNQKK